LDLFSDVAEDSPVLNDLLAGRIDVPVQVYAGIGGGVLPERIVSKIEAGEQICNNVSVLSKFFGFGLKHCLDFIFFCFQLQND
jgi:hypothetical protein